MPIITTAEYKAARGITDATWDARLDIYIPQTQAALERFCGRLFDETVYVDKPYDGNGERSLWVLDAPVTAVAAVKTVDQDGTETTLATTDYRWTEPGEFFLLNDISGYWGDCYGMGWGIGGACDGPVWPDGAPSNVLLSFTGGYSTAPDDLKGLMYQLLDALFDEAGENFNLSATGNGVESKTWLAPDLIATRYAYLCRPWRQIGTTV